MAAHILWVDVRAGTPTIHCLVLHYRRRNKVPKPFFSKQKQLVKVFKPVCGYVSFIPNDNGNNSPYYGHNDDAIFGYAGGS